MMEKEYRDFLHKSSVQIADEIKTAEGIIVTKKAEIASLEEKNKYRSALLKQITDRISEKAPSTNGKTTLPGFTPSAAPSPEVAAPSETKEEPPSQPDESSRRRRVKSKLGQFVAPLNWPEGSKPTIQAVIPYIVVRNTVYSKKMLSHALKQVFPDGKFNLNSLETYLNLWARAGLFRRLGVDKYEVREDWRLPT